MTKLLSMLALFVFIMSVGAQVAHASGEDDDSSMTTTTSEDVFEDDESEDTSAGMEDEE